MGQYWSSRTPVERFTLPLPSNGTILINQADCNMCHDLVRDKGTCKCGNVTVDGGLNELGRTIKDKNQYSDCNMIEYKSIHSC